MTDRDDRAATPPVPPENIDAGAGDSSEQDYRSSVAGTPDHPAPGADYSNGYAGAGYDANGYAQPQPYAGAAGYGQPAGYGYPEGYGQPAPRKTLSIIGMVLGILGLLGAWIVVFPFFGSFLALFFPAAAVVLGFLGRSREGAPAKGFWLTALITGFVTIAIAVVALVGYIALFAVGGFGRF